MPAWTVELFAGEKLNRAFWIILAIPAPVWLCLIFLPSAKFTRWVAHPFVTPTLMLIPLGYFYYEAWDLGGVAWPGGIGYTEARDVIFYPTSFLILWCQLQTLHLFLGLVVYQHAIKRSLHVPGELIACWVLGPVGILVYLIRLAIWRLCK